MKKELTKQDFERLEAILKQFPETDAPEHVNFNVAAKTADFLVKMAANSFQASGSGIREGIYTSTLYLCINLLAIEESEPELSGERADEIFLELFKALRKETRQIAQYNAWEKRQTDRDPAIGEVVNYGFRNYRVVPDFALPKSSDDEPCSGCAFLTAEGDCNVPFFCTSDYRSDEREVKFVDVTDEMQPPVGSVYEQDGKRYQIVSFTPSSIEEDNCEGCPFAPTEEDPNCHCNISCHEDFRLDGQSIRFIPIEEGGEA